MMWSLPAGWRWKPAEFLAEDSERRNPKHTPEKSFRYVDISSVNNQEGELKLDEVRNVEGSKAPSRARKVIRAGDVIFAITRPYLRNIALIPEDLEDEICSTGFCVLRPRQGRAISEFIYYACRSNFFINQIIPKQRGASYPAVTDTDVYETLLPVPYADEPERSVTEQRRIVARIEALLGEVREMRKLQEEISADVQAFYRSLIFNHSSWTPAYHTMSDLVTRIDTNERVQDEKLYRFAGVKSFGRGVFKGKAIYGRETSYKRLTRLSKGNFTYPKLMAWEGALGSVPAELDGYVVSPEYPVFEVNEEIVLPEVLDVYFRTPTVWPILADLSAGTNARRRRLHPNVFLTYKFPVPPMKIQMYLREAVRQFDGQEEMLETAQLLEDLEPAILNLAFRGEL